jgi:hypothetical protein
MIDSRAAARTRIKLHRKAIDIWENEGGTPQSPPKSADKPLNLTIARAGFRPTSSLPLA